MAQLPEALSEKLIAIGQTDVSGCDRPIAASYGPLAIFRRQRQVMSLLLRAIRTVKRHVHGYGASNMAP